MATVFLARDVRHDREVAIKVLHPDLAATIGGDRFEREIRLAAKLQHPHILGMYDSGVADGLLYYVMPFVQGESLRDRLEREGQLPIDDALQITLEVADALGYAHQQDIVHRDIKPENILLANGHALVADFGIARAAHDGGGQKLTQTGMALGTPVYMSPEQASGEAVGPAADIYSLGCVLYEMLAGEPPFTGKNAMAIMARHAMEGVPSVRIIRASVPEEVEEAILAAMEKAVADRPKSAAEFAAILGTPLGSTAMRRVTMRHTAARRVSGAGLRTFAQAGPVWKRPWVLGGTAAAVLVAAFSAWKLVGRSSAGATVASADPRAWVVAVRYLEDGSSGHEFGDVASRLTEALIGDLQQIPRLTVRTRGAVAPFRDADVTRDSIARALDVGTLVEGSVQPDGKDKVTISTRLYDANGTDLGVRKSITVPRDSLFLAEDAVAAEVAASLKQRLGSEIELRTTRAGTRSMAAWTLFSRAEKLLDDAQALLRANSDSSAMLVALTDSLLRQAESSDATWIEPKLLRGEAALHRARLASIALEQNRGSVEQVSRLLDTALVRANDAMAADPTSARAQALRGTVEYAKWRDRALSDAVRHGFLDNARNDLESAVQRDPRIASADVTLSNLYYDEEDVPTANKYARAAYEADAFLSNTAGILVRLFWTSYDTNLLADARKWCDEGAKRFPTNYNFAICGLWLMLIPNAEPDAARAWSLAARVDSLAPQTTKSFQSHLARMIVAGVIGRAAKAAPIAGQQAALRDSAENVIASARADPTIDPEGELPGYEALVRTQMGDYARAVTMLTQYVATHPTHTFLVGSNVHWWWRSLQNQPGFQALKARAR